MQPKHKALAGISGVKITNGDTGEFEAVFAVLEVKDYDGDVTMKGAFENGAEVRISAYNHKSWGGELPVGKGVIEEVGDKAVVKGRFFLDTQAGRETFTVVKEMGGLQEWSYGYDTLEEERGTFKGMNANIIRRQKVHEVSPVILGAGIGTQTTSIKSKFTEADEETKQLYSEFADMLRSAGREKFGANKERYVWVEDFDMDDNWVIYRVCEEVGSATRDGDRLVRMNYTRKDEEVELSGDEEEVEVTYVAATGSEDKSKKSTEGEPGTKGEPERESDEDLEATATKTLTEEEQALPAGRKMAEVTGSLKQMYSEVYWTLNELGKERFRRHMYCEIYDVDIDKDIVIYRCREEGDECLMRISFERDSDGNIELSDEEEEVEIEQTFVAAKARDDEHDEKKATPYNATATSTDEWDGPGTAKAIAKEGAAVYKQMFAWVDPSGNPNDKGSYHFLHHEWTDGKPGAANLAACASCIGILNGENGGTAIPDADIPAVYAHLAKHIKAGGKTPPALKKASGKAASEETDSEKGKEGKEKAAKSEGGDHDEKKATPFKSTATSTDSWSGPKTVAAIPNDAGADVLKQMFAWVDPKGDPDKKSSYKFPHHEWVNGKPGPANLKACTAGIGILNGGRGGTNIPDADRQGVYNHLARHLKDGDKEPPELKAAPEPTGLKLSDHIDAVMTEIDELSERAVSVVTLRAEKGKKRLGAESYALLKELTTRMDSLKGFLEDSDSNDDAELSPVDKAFLDTIASSLD